MMCKVDMSIPVGEEQWQVSISSVGMGNSIGIIVNDMFEGYVVKYATGWIFWPSTKRSVIYSEDIFIILDIFRNRFPDMEVFGNNYDWVPRVNVNSNYDHCYLIPMRRRRK